MNMWKKICEKAAGLEPEIREKIGRILAAAVLLAAAMIITARTALPLWAQLLIYLVPYVLISYDLYAEAFEDMKKGEVFSEDLLMCIATLGALAIGFLPGMKPEFAEAVFVMLFFQLGETFEDIAEGSSRRSISQLMEIRPDSANVERDGEVVTVSPEEVQVGEIVVIRPGEKVPMDGTVLEGKSSLDTAALTGESVPRDVEEGDEIVSGCVNLSGVLRVRAAKAADESTAARILELVENAGENKSRSETFITKFARVYTPGVVIAALLLAVLPPLFSGNFGSAFPLWFGRALTFLVVSCPCALVISVPLTFFCGIGGASRKGILIKGANYMDALARTETVVFDKTGTLTEGVFEVTDIHPEEISAHELLHLAAHVERYSTHPIAASLRAAYPEENDDCTVEETEEVSGQGIIARINGRRVAVGNTKLMDGVGAGRSACEKAGTVLHIAIDGEYAGYILVSDRIKADSAEAVRALRACGVSRTVMLTGDREEVGRHVAETLGLDEYRAGLLPADKVTAVEELLEKKEPKKALAFAGDGMNDAPVLARADVGIAMGALGSDAAIEAADVVLMDDQPSKIAAAIRISRRTIGIARQNAVFAIAVKLAALVLAGMGLAGMGLAVFADVGVTVLAVLNAMRAMKN